MADSPASALPRAATPAPAPGLPAGDFEPPVAELGSGATGRVLKVRQISVNRFVALKVLDRRPGDAQIAARHQREAEALGRLRHPGIVTIYGAGVRDGIPYMAMECLEGGTLDRKIAERTAARGAFTELEIARLGLDVARALAAAMKEGIVHRDLKPTNVLFDREGRPVVTDFGMAKFLDPRAGDEKLTGTGDVLGTPEYMAPEQIMPSPDVPVDHRADIYALGCVLHTMATLSAPFPARTPYEAMDKHIKAAPEPIRTINSGYSEALERLILKCLVKSPEDRPGYDEILTELRALAEGGATGTPRRTTKSRTVMLLSALVAVAVAIVWIAVARRQTGRPTDGAAMTDNRSDTPAVERRDASDKRAEAQHPPAPVSNEEPREPAPDPTPGKPQYWEDKGDGDHAAFFHFFG